MSSVRQTTPGNARFSRGLTRFAKFACSLAVLGVGIGLSLGAAVPADAANQPAARLSPEEQAHVSRIQSYLNRITTMQARFIQTSPNGKVAKGTLSIQRPGNFRFEYDPPVPHTLISNGTWFIHVDRELGESNFLPLDRTPARFLLAEKVSFSEDVRVLGFRREDGLLHLKLQNKDNPDLGYVTVTFNERPLAIRQWIVHDAQNKQTRVTLQNTRFGMKLKDDLFEFVEPDRENLYQ